MVRSRRTSTLIAVARVPPAQSLCRDPQNRHKRTGAEIYKMNTAGTARRAPRGRRRKAGICSVELGLCSRSAAKDPQKTLSDMRRRPRSAEVAASALQLAGQLAAALPSMQAVRQASIAWRAAHERARRTSFRAGSSVASGIRTCGADFAVDDMLPVQE